MAALMQDRLEAIRRRRRFIILITFLAILVALIFAFRAVLMPFLVALFAAYLIDPVINRMTLAPIGSRFRLGRGTAVLVLYGGLLVLLYVAGTFAIPALKAQIVQVRTELPRFQEFVQTRAEAVVLRWRKLVGEQEEAAAAAAVPAGEAAPPEEAEEMQPRIRLTLLGGGMIQGRLVARLHDKIVLDAGNDLITVETRRVASEDLLSALKVVLTDGTVYRGDPLAEREEVLYLDTGIEVRQIPVKTIARRTILFEHHDEGAADVKKIIAQGFNQFVRNLDSVLLFSLRLLTWLVRAVYQIFLIMMITAFLVIDREKIVRFLHAIPPERQQGVSRRLGAYIDLGLAGVIRGQLLICTVNGILTWTGLEFIGVRYALMLGFFAGVMSLIPIFGTILSSIPIVLIAFATSGGGWQLALLALGWILLIHFVEANFLNPKIMGHASKIHPVVIIFALLAGEHTYGIVGALLAVPTASILQSMFKFYVIDKQAELPDDFPVTAT
ncbi:MAG: AI-2E family transporter [Planctomycetaceae bacterium]